MNQRASKSRSVPRYVTEQYEGGSRAFKAEKRRQVSAALKAVGELRLGCAHFPSGAVDVELAQKALKSVQADISRKNWGK